MIKNEVFDKVSGMLERHC